MNQCVKGCGDVSKTRCHLGGSPKLWLISLLHFTLRSTLFSALLPVLSHLHRKQVSNGRASDFS